jgi:hypothetical protein
MLHRIVFKHITMSTNVYLSHLKSNQKWHAWNSSRIDRFYVTADMLTSNKWFAWCHRIVQPSPKQTSGFILPRVQQVQNMRTNILEQWYMLMDIYSAIFINYTYSTSQHLYCLTHDQWSPSSRSHSHSTVFLESPNLAIPLVRTCNH